MCPNPPSGANKDTRRDDAGTPKCREHKGPFAEGGLGGCGRRHEGAGGQGLAPGPGRRGRAASQGLEQEGSGRREPEY